ncbi:hypothetical protein BsWGS_09312 [Bradybaena similaris]
MHSLISKRLMASLITVALLCCVVILFTPSITFIPGTDVRAAARMQLLPTTTDSATTDSGVESKIHEDLEFHAKQGASIKLDFNRLALEGLNSVKASSGISDSNSLGAGETIAGPETMKDLVKASSGISDSNSLGASETHAGPETLKVREVRSNFRDQGKKDFQSRATKLNLTK